MKKFFRFLLKTVFVLVVLLVGLIIILPMVIDPNDYKSEISEAVTSATGRDIRLDGKISWSLFPSVALKFEDVSLSNASGFKGDMFEADQLAASVRLLPLLKKNIQVGQVTLIKPVINLQTNKFGVNNWDDLLEGQASTNTTEANSNIDLQVRGIAINSGTLSYVDEQGPSHIQLKDLNFDIDEVATDKASEISIIGQLLMPDTGLDAQLDAKLSISGLVADTGIKMSFHRLRLDGQWSADASVPLIVNADAGEVDLVADTLRFNPLSIQLGDEHIMAQVSGNQISKVMNLHGEVSIKDFHMARLLKAMQAPLVNDADNIINGTAKWSMVNNQLEVSELQLKLDDYVMGGDLKITDLSAIKGQFNLNMDSFNLDQYLPQNEGEVSTTGSQSHLNLGQLHGQINIGQLIAAGLELSDISLKVNTNGQRLDIEPLNANFYQGLIRSQLHLNAANQDKKVTLSHSMKDIEAGSMLQALMDSEYITGKAAMEASLSIDEPFSERPFKTANGMIDLSVRDGDIKGIDVFDIIQKSLSLTGQSEVQLQDENLKTEFGSLLFKAKINQGVLHSEELFLNSPYFKVRGNIKIDLDQQSIDGQIRPVLTNIPEAVLGPEFKKLLNVKIPVKLTGSLLSPSITIDLKSLIIDTQKDRLLDKLLGEDEKEDPNKPLTEKEKKKREKDRLKQALLKGLLGGDKDDKNRDEEGGK